MSVRRSVRACLVAGAVLAVAAACSASSSNTSRAGKSMSDARAPGQALKQPAGGAAAQPVQPIADTRSIIFTGTVTVAVSDVERAAADATVITTAAGGFVGGDDRTAGRGDQRATLTLRVPSAQFAATVDKVSGLGREQSRQLSTQDVTDQVTDVNARIATGEAGVDRIRALIAKAQNMSDIVSLESELSRRESDLDSLKARQRSLGDQVTLSTITAVFQPLPAAAHPAQHHTGFVAGLTAGWHGFVRAMTVLVTVLGAVLPWVVLFGVPAGAVLWWRRRRRPVRLSSSA